MANAIAPPASGAETLKKKKSGVPKWLKKLSGKTSSKSGSTMSTASSNSTNASSKIKAVHIPESPPSVKKSTVNPEASPMSESVTTSFVATIPEPASDTAEIGRDVGTSEKQAEAPADLEPHEELAEESVVEEAVTLTENDYLPHNEVAEATGAGELVEDNEPPSQVIAAVPNNMFSSAMDILVNVFPWLNCGDGCGKTADETEEVEDEPAKLQ
eukprot:scaffold62942_cov30-Prasinocladus_malaysianus.AAC.1